MEPALPGVALRPTGGRDQAALGVLSLMLAAASVAAFWLDLAPRREAAALLTSCGLNGRPAITDTIRLIESGDLVSAFAVEAALAELAPGGQASASTRFGSGSLAALTAARDLAASAAAARPGWAYHRLLLARAGYALWDVGAGPRAQSTPAWRQAFGLAGQAGPGLDVIWTSSAASLLEAWPRLSPREREQVPEVLRRAFLSADFVRWALPDAVMKMGPAALGLLPDTADSLGEAAAVLRATGQPEAAEAVAQRLRRIRPEEGTLPLSRQ